MKKYYKYTMLNSKRLRQMSGWIVVCLLMAGFCSCGTSRRMGCPMQFGRADQPVMKDQQAVAPARLAAVKPMLLCTAS